jgi:hypothetical protein
MSWVPIVVDDVDVYKEAEFYDSYDSQCYFTVYTFSCKLFVKRTETTQPLFDSGYIRVVLSGAVDSLKQNPRDNGCSWVDEISYLFSTDSSSEDKVAVSLLELEPYLSEIEDLGFDSDSDELVVEVSGYSETDLGDPTDWIVSLEYMPVSTDFWTSLVRAEER